MFVSQQRVVDTLQLLSTGHGQPSMRVCFLFGWGGGGGVRDVVSAAVAHST
jgi:hypothetical protein